MIINSFTIIYLVLFYILTIIFFINNSNKKTILPFVLSYSFAFFMIVLFVFYTNADPHFKSDGNFYYNDAKLMLVEGIYLKGNAGWTYVNYLFLSIFDEPLYLIRLFNMTIYISLVILSIKVMEKKLDISISMYYSIILCFIPSIFFFSILNLKETSILFLAYCTILLWSSSLTLFNKVLVSMPLLFLLTLERFYMLVLFVTMLTVFVFNGSFFKSKTTKFITFTFISLLFISALAIINSMISFEYIIGSFNEVAKYSATSLDRYISPPSSFFDIIVTLPYRVLLYILIPFPWETKNIVFLIGVLENYLLFIPMLFYILKNFKTVRKDKYLLMLFSFVVANILFYSSTMSNMGIVVRMKSHALFFIILIFIYLKFYNRKQK